MSGLSGLPLRDDLVGEEPYGAPQIDVPVVLNVNENPYPPSGELRRAMGEAVQEAAATMNRYRTGRRWRSARTWPPTSATA